MKSGHAASTLRILNLNAIGMLAEAEDQEGEGPSPSPAPAAPISIGERFPLAAGFAASSISVATAVLLTNWVDVIKVRQQLAGPEAQNLLLTGINVVRNEGVFALYRGVTPAVLRGMLYGGLRIGLYTPFKQALASKEGEDPGLALKIVAGMTSGAVAAGACNPTDLVKTRLQMVGAGGSSSLNIIKQVTAESGVKGLWKGTTPSMARAALLTAAQCATYDEVKLLFTRHFGWEDGLGTHLAVSGVAGLVTTTVTAPVDMIKTNMFVHTYAGPWDCVRDIYGRMGVRGLFKGWGANWARQGPMTTLVFVVNEMLRPMLGLDAL